MRRGQGLVLKHAFGVGVFVNACKVPIVSSLSSLHVAVVVCSSFLQLLYLELP